MGMEALAEMAKNAYKLFKNNETLETGGVTLDYGSFKIVVARAGGSNKRFAKALEAKLRPHRRAVETGTLDETLNRRLLVEVYAETVILGWENMQDEAGEALAFTRENVMKVMTDLPDLFADVVEQTNKVAIFKDMGEEDDVKN
jgi:hypothetical protein